MGVTPEYSQARVARARIRTLGLEDRIKLYTGDATNMPIQISASVGHFDKIVSLDSVRWVLSGVSDAHGV
jgi:cyclopropane fatty-acyl-phospholipid synthase-like methyltransferase